METASQIPYRIYSRREFVALLKSIGFISDRFSKHEVFIRGSMSIAIPSSPTMNKMLTRRLIKQLNSEM